MRGRWVVFGALALLGGCGGSGGVPDGRRDTDGQASDSGATADAGPSTDAGSTPDADAADGPASDAPATPDAPPADAADAADRADATSVDAVPPDVGGSCEVVRALSPSESVAYTPMAVGDRWTYRGRWRLLAATDYRVEYQQRLEVTGTKTLNGAEAFVVTDTNPNGNPGPVEEYLAVSGAGLVNNGSTQYIDVPGTSPAAAPYVELPFPVRVCSAFQQFRMMSDYYGTIISVSVLRSLEAITVSGVSFPDALRVERNVTFEKSTDGGPPSVGPISSTVEWYAPGIGRVKRTVLTADREHTYDITGARVGGVAHGVLPGGNIAMLDVYSAFLGGSDRPAVASDGQNFLVLSSTSTSLYDGGMAAMLVGPDGRLIKSTPIVQGGRVPVSPAVAYGEGRYLVVYPTYNSTIKAVMLSADGTQQGSAFDIWGTGPPAVAYGRGVFLVATNQGQSIGLTIVSGQGAVLGEVIPYPGQPQGSPALAFDGRNFLMAFLAAVPAQPSGTSIQVAAARVNADGNAIDVAVAQLSNTPLLLEEVDLVFDGTRYVTSWFQRANSSSIGGGEIRIARVGADGVLLDPGGRVIAPARSGTSKMHSRIARLGSQTIVVWERINYQAPGQSIWIAGTRVDADGNSLDSSAADDGLFLSAQPTGNGNQPIVPAIGWGGDRSLLVFIDRAGETTAMKRKIDGTLIHPW